MDDKTVQTPLVTAFSPASLSCIFAPLTDRPPEQVVSRGLRICLDTGLTVVVTPATQTVLIINGTQGEIGAVSFALSSLSVPGVRVEITAAFPFASGFGMSAAATLATTLAVNSLFSLGLTRSEILETAHVADVRGHTGIGDVGAQGYGGVTVKFDGMDPLQLEPLDIAPVPLYVRVFGAIDTAAVLGNPAQRSRIEQVGVQTLQELQSQPVKSLRRILELSYLFALESGLLQDARVQDAITQVQQAGGTATMVMLGNSVLADIPFPGAQKVMIGTRGAEVE